MPTVRRNPITAFYRALSPMGRWPRWLLIGILLYSLIAMLALIGYALTGPSSGALTVAIDNFLFLWAVGFVPAAILMLLLLGRARLWVWRFWGNRLLFAGMIGVFAAFLCLCASINTILPMPRLLGTWALLLATLSADIAILGLILLGIRFLPRMYWRRWTIWLWLVAMLGFVLSASYQAIAAVAPALRVPAIVQAASAVQSVSYFLGLLSVIAGQIYSLTARSSHQQAPQSAPPQ